MLLAEFVLDSTSTTTYAPPAQTSDITYNNKIYDSGPLSQAPHKLVVTPKNEHLVWIDYVLVHQAGPMSTVTNLGTSTTNAVTNFGTSTTNTVTNLGTSTTNTAGAIEHSAISSGAIAGIAVAVLAVLVLLLIGLRWRQRALSKLTAANNQNRKSFFLIKSPFLTPQFLRRSKRIP